MTSSFQPGNFNTDTSQYNYAKESPDLASMVNANIDRNKEILDQHYNRLVEMNNAAQKADVKKWDSIAQITGTAIRLKPFIEDLRKSLDPITDQDRLNSDASIYGSASGPCRWEFLAIRNKNYPRPITAEEENDTYGPRPTVGAS